MIKKAHSEEQASGHALNKSGNRINCEGPTSVGQPALGLEPASILNGSDKDTRYLVCFLTGILKSQYEQRITFK